MKTLVAPVVAEKLNTLDENSKREFSALLEVISELDAGGFEAFQKRNTLLDAEGNLYVVRRGLLRVFYTLGEADGEPYLLVLDVASMERPRGAIVGSKDPRINTQLNPYVNTSINPYRNTSLNPYVNTSLNPYVNTSLNPQVNTSINPAVNRSLNPYVNTSLNPYVNRSLNPALNRSMNPIQNPRFAGMRFFDTNLEPRGFAIQPNANLLLRFDPDLQFVGIGVRNSLGGYSLFDTGMVWTGYLVPDRRGGYLTFDLNAGWSGFVTA